MRIGCYVKHYIQHRLDSIDITLEVIQDLEGVEYQK
ncbi:MAG: hypothetical protein HNEKOMLI_00630 [Sodalis sp. Psp]|nr:hypothetical protein [Sodalis sp. Psp]MCR3757097.1 hypothetical protein [Sodalis sp. Ppy]